MIVTGTDADGSKKYAVAKIIDGRTLFHFVYAGNHRIINQIIPGGSETILIA